MRHTRATPFKAWLHEPDQHGARDPIGELARAMHADPLKPNPGDLDELRSYLTSVGASPDTHRIAVEAWACFQAERHSRFGREVAEYAEQWHDGEPFALSIADLLDELDYESDRASVQTARDRLIALGPWFIGKHDTTVRVELGTVTLDYGAAARLERSPLYQGSERAD